MTLTACPVIAGEEGGGRCPAAAGSERGNRGQDRSTAGAEEQGRQAAAAAPSPTASTATTAAAAAVPGSLPGPVTAPSDYSATAAATA